MGRDPTQNGDITMATITKVDYKRKGTNAGKSTVLKTEAGAGQERETELYHNPGIATGPTVGDEVVTVNVGTSGRIAVATQNYRLEVEVTAGETKIYSTSADGETLKSLIELDTAGLIKLNGDSKSFVTHLELNTSLQAYVTAVNALFATKLDGGGTAGTATLDISSAATTTIKTGG